MRFLKVVIFFHFFTLGMSTSFAEKPSVLLADKVEACLHKLKKRNSRKVEKVECLSLSLQLLKRERTILSKKTYLDVLDYFSSRQYNFEEAYSSYFKSLPILKKLTIQELKDLLESYYLISFYVHWEKPARQFTSIFKELKKRGEISPEDGLKVFNIMISSRLWDDLEEFAVNNNISNFHFPKIRNFENLTSEPSIFKYSKKEDGLVFHRLEKGFFNDKIIGVVSLDCAFSENALKNILNNPSLYKAFSQSGVLILSQNENIDFRKLEEWNKSHPDLPIHIVYKESLWPLDIGWDNFPRFYYFKNDKLLHTSGWGESNLIKGIEAFNHN